MPILLAWGTLLYGAAPKFEVKLSSNEVRAGQEIQLSIGATWEGTMSDCIFGEVVLEIPEYVEIGAIRPLKSAVEFTDGTPTSSYKYQCTLRPIAEGEFSIAEIEVKFRFPETKPNEWESWRLSKPLNFTATKTVFDNKNVRLAVIIVGGMVFIVCAVFAVAAYRYKKQVAEEHTPIDCETKCLEELSDLRTLRIKGDYKTYLSDLAALIHRYGELKYGLVKATNEHLVDKMSQYVGAPQGRRIKEILQLTEDVGFGGVPPLPTELDRAHHSVKDVLLGNQPQKNIPKPEDEISLRDS